MADRVQVLGLCRFSVPVEGGFQHVHGSLDERRAALYQPARLDRRFAWFEHVFLPGLAAQTDPDFALLIVTGPDMPEPWSSRLDRLIARVPQLRRVRVGPDAAHRDLMRRVMMAARDPDALAVAEFRLDDDDGVAFDYVARIRRDFGQLRRLYVQDGSFAVDHAKGFLLAREDGAFRAELRVTAAWGCALTVYVPPMHPKSVFDYTHFRIHRWMPLLTRADQPMYVRGWHGGNDTPRIGAGQGAEPVDLATALPRLRRRFGLDLEAFGQTLTAIEAAPE